ncbi:unnamed protein product [Polarella glacialis]|uniref:Pentatricopeptide repeat-containing protein, chloroplastic n=1 Tax=Polarella glacialis TaxID=89957 RepID=A0A813EQ56_POLGL|nr:unnamed protein product [Polarella glacialis]
MSLSSGANHQRALKHAAQHVPASWLPGQGPTGPNLRWLLPLGPQATMAELRQSLAPALRAWAKRPKQATQMLTDLAKHELPEIALKVLRCMLHARLEINVFHCSAVMAACEKSGRWQLALSLLLQMPGLRVSPNEFSYNTAISACPWDLAMGLLSKMFDKHLRPDKVSYCAGIDTVRKGGQWQTALRILTKMHEMDVIPNDFSYNAAITSCESGRQWQLALRLLSSMPEMRVTPTVASYNAAMSACDKGGWWQYQGGQWQLALCIMCNMPQAKLMPNEISYTAAISACSSSRGQWLIALELLHTMRRSSEKASPNEERCYNAAISACEKSARWRFSLALLSMMLRNRITPTEVGCNSAMISCSRKALWPWTLILLKSMPGKFLAPNAVSYSAAAGACEKWACWQLAVGFLHAVEPSLGDDWETLAGLVSH